MKNLALTLVFLSTLFLFSCQDKQEKMRAEILFGQEALHKSDFQKAEIHFQKAVEIDPENPEPYLLLGRLYISKNNLNEALKNTNLALKYNSKYGEAYRTKAQIHFLMGDRDAACENYKLAKENGIPNLDNYLQMCR